MSLERKIELYPLGIRNEVQVIPTGEFLQTNAALTIFIEEQNKPKYNSWIPVVKRINDPGMIDMDRGTLQYTIEAGVMSYAQAAGIIKAIAQEKDFTPKVITNLSIGVIPVTKDDYIMISRRNPKIDHAPGVWNFAGGYMASGFIDLKNCSDKEFASDPRLFDIHEQLKKRIQRQEFTGLEETDFAPARSPNALALGFYHSQEMELGWVVRFNKTANELREHVRNYEIEKGVEEHSENLFLKIEDIDEMLLNQGDLLNENPVKYTTKDPRRVLLLDDNIGELIGGAYAELKGKLFYGRNEMTEKFIDPLNKKGFKIILKREYPYNFPLSV